MPHIHTQPNQHDHTVSAYIIRDDGNEPRMLLHMHKKLGMLLPVGGHIELDETPWAAVAHELEEESGYSLEDLSVMQPHLRIKQAEYEHIVVHPQPVLMNTHLVSDEHYHSDTGYLFLAHAGPTRALAAGESTDLRWLTSKEIAALTNDEIWQRVQRICLEALDIFMNEWEAVATTEFSSDKIHP